MNFLTPAAFSLLLLLPVIIAMYLLKLRRTEQVVSSVFLWRRMVRDVEANAPWQRLRRNLLMFLQLLFLVLLIFALARPFSWTEGVSGQAAIIVIDASASMASTDIAPSRLEAAKDQARQMVGNLPDDARVTVIEAGETARVLAASTQDRRLAYSAIESIRGGSGGSDMATALGLASAVAARQPDTQLILLSDGRFEMPERFTIKGQVTYLPIGLDGDNLAVSLLTLTANPGGESLTAFAQVSNYSDKPAQRRLELYGNGLLVNAFDLEIAAKGQQAVIAENLLAGTQTVEARLTGGDTLPTDDVAWATFNWQDTISVTLVTDGNYFLETALSLLPGVQLAKVSPAEYERGQGTSGAGVLNTRLTVFDSYVPITATLPAENLFFIQPLRSTAYFTVTGRVERPAVQTLDSNHPLLQNIVPAELKSVSLLDATRLALPGWAYEVVQGVAAKEGEITTSPLLLAGSVEGRQVAVLAFDFRHSDLPLMTSFPLLLSNLMEWYKGSSLPTQVAPGQAISIPLDSPVTQVTVVRPDGSRAQLAPDAGQVVFADTRQLGIYEVRWGQSGSAHFAVNLSSPQESDVLPRQEISVLSTAGSDNAPGLQQARREWWRPLAYGALAFLVAEWLVYNRANLARLLAVFPLRFRKT